MMLKAINRLEQMDRQDLLTKADVKTTEHEYEIRKIRCFNDVKK